MLIVFKSLSDLAPDNALLRPFNVPCTVSHLVPARCLLCVNPCPITAPCLWNALPSQVKS